MEPRARPRRPSPMRTFERGMAVQVCSIVVVTAVLASGCSLFNDQVATEVELPGAIGDRELVDGECASTEATGTEPCRPSGVRYTP